MINTLINQLKKQIQKQIDFDWMLCVSTEVYPDKMLTYEVKKKIKRYKFPKQNEESIVNVVSKSLQPNIINYVEDSFLYDEKSDNPLSYNMSRMAVIPCYFKEDKYPFSMIVLYRKKKENNFFTKENIKLIQKIIFNHLNLHKSFYKKITRKIIFLNSHNIKTENSQYELEQSKQFFSSVIHDIRTPMNAVMGFLELLEDTVDPKQKEYISAAYKSSEMVIALINDVLDFNKISMGKMEIDYHYFSLLEVMKNTALLFYHNAVQKGLDFIIYYDPYIPYLIKSDSFRIKQILNNLLSNAIKFTDTGGMVVMEFLYDEKNDTLTCKVSDTGIGISQESQKDIFRPFTQANSETSGQYGGTGLGLSISKQLTHLLGGELYLKSEEGKGSEFSISLPCNSIENTGISIEIDKNIIPNVYIIDGELSKNRYILYFKKYFERAGISYEIINEKDAIEHSNNKENIYVAMKLDYSSSICRQLIDLLYNRLIILETNIFSDVVKFPQDTIVLEMPIFPEKIFDALTMLSKGESSESNEEIVKTTVSKNKDKYILIADDNPINLKLTEEIVHKLGFFSRVAKNGQEAVDIFRKKSETYDIILIDQNMPLLSGSEAIKIIRSLEDGDKPYIYGLTGDSDEETSEEMKKAGANAILHKPIKVKELKEVLFR